MIMGQKTKIPSPDLSRDSPLALYAEALGSKASPSTLASTASNQKPITRAAPAIPWGTGVAQSTEHPQKTLRRNIRPAPPSAPRSDEMDCHDPCCAHVGAGVGAVGGILPFLGISFGVPTQTACLSAAGGNIIWGAAAYVGTIACCWAATLGFHYGCVQRGREPSNVIPPSATYNIQEAPPPIEMSRKPVQYPPQRP